MKRTPVKIDKAIMIEAAEAGSAAFGAGINTPHHDPKILPLYRRAWTRADRFDQPRIAAKVADAWLKAWFKEYHNAI